MPDWLPALAWMGRVEDAARPAFKSSGGGHELSSGEACVPTPRGE